MVLSEAAATGPTFFNLVPWVVFFPVLGILINIIFGKRMGEKLVGTVASTASGLAFVVSVLQAISLLAQPEGAIVPLVDWINIGELHVPWAFQVDTLSVTMMLVVSGVGSVIHVYSIGYMHEDVRIHKDLGRYRRFFVFLNLFIAAMMILVSGDNYLMLFVGWEGVGLCSFLLIGFWFEYGPEGIGNAMAAKKAFVTNRVGDLGMLIAIFTIFWAFGSLNFKEVFDKAPQVATAMPGVILAITLFMLLGVAGKSAQLPLYVWLPDAMAGPTPVSALIHAATMVTAGVYLVSRSYALYTLVPVAQTTVAVVGGVTALFAATIAVGQFDIKRVLAYSTISQLGFMVAAVGMGAFVAGMFHLVTHAFFKGLLFLSSGSVIQGLEEGHHHALEHSKKKHKESSEFDPQDMRNMGGLRTRMPITFWVYTIAALALAGVPPLAGFFSKDEILAEATRLNFTVYILLTIAAFLTAFYIFRQIFMVFFGEAHSEAAEQTKESRPLITIPLMILAALSVFGGALNLPGIQTFHHWLEHTIGGLHPGEFSPFVAVLSSVLALLGIGIAWIFYERRYRRFLEIPRAKRPADPLVPIIGPVFTALENKWWVDELYWAVILTPYIKLARFLADVVDWRFWHDWFHEKIIAGGYNLLSNFLAVPVDLGIIDGIANGLGKAAESLSAVLRRLQTGFVRTYALSVFLGVVIILGYLILR